MGRVRVLVVDDHEVVRAGLRWLLGRAPWVQSCACAATTEEAVALARSLRPDVALVDVHLGGYGGLRACLQLRRHAPGVRVALLSSRWDIVPLRLAREVGALGVVAKEAPGRALLGAVRDLAVGLEVDVPSPHPEPVRLLPSDREILRLTAAGMTNAEIGARVHLAPGTVKQHTRELYTKLGVTNRAGAVHAARRMGVTAGIETGGARGDADGRRRDGGPRDDGGPRRGDAGPRGGAGAVSVLVADADDVTRAGHMVALRGQPWVTRCRGAADPDEALRAARLAAPDVALVGRCGDPLALSRALTATGPAVRTLLVRDGDTAAHETLRAAGASGIVLRSWPARRLAAAVRAAGAGAAMAPPRADAEGVSPREREVLRVLVTGATNAEIAGRLGLSPHTVKQHTCSIYRKLGIRNRAEAAGRAEAMGVL